MSLVPNITQIAEEHAQLEQVIANYDHAPADLRETKDLLESIEKDLKVRESRMRKLIEKRKAEHKDLDSLQRSSTKRFFIRVKHGGKEGLERRLEKEEREYIEAAQNEHNENVAISELKAAADNARLKKADLESQVAIRKEMLQRLDDLYQSAFDGPSPDFPEEDVAEDELREAEVHFEHTQARLSHEKDVFSVLDQAAACANRVQAALQSANAAATYDMFSVGGVWAQMAEADHLVRAQTLSTQVKHLLDRARDLQQLVKPITPPKVVSPEWLNVVFDNLYTDFMFQQKIKQSIESVRKYQEAIFAECAASEERVRNLERDANDAREFLKSRRRQLVATRREILTRIREEGGVRVFARPDTDSTGNESRSVPQLPTYAQQPEEGSKVLARGGSQGISTVSLPLDEEQVSPPRYDSPSASAPSFPETHTHTEAPRISRPPPGHAESEFGPWSRQLFSSSTAASAPTETETSTEMGVNRRGTTARTGSTSISDENAVSRRNEWRVPFATNNPYRTSRDPSG